MFKSTIWLVQALDPRKHPAYEGVRSMIETHSFTESSINEARDQAMEKVAELLTDNPKQSGHNYEITVTKIQ